MDSPQLDALEATLAGASESLRLCRRAVASTAPALARLCLEACHDELKEALAQLAAALGPDHIQGG